MIDDALAALEEQEVLNAHVLARITDLVERGAAEFGTTVPRSMY